MTKMYAYIMGVFAIVAIAAFLMWNTDGNSKDVAAESQNSAIEKTPDLRQVIGEPQKDTTVIKIDATYDGYEPSVIYVHTNERVRIEVNSLDDPHGILIIDLGLYGEDYVEFTTPSEPQIIEFMCANNCDNTPTLTRNGVDYEDPDADDETKLRGEIHVK